MLALRGGHGLAPGNLEGLAGENFALEAVREGRRVEVARVVRAGRGAQGHDGAGHVGVEQGAVGGDAHADMGARGDGGAPEAVEHVVEGAAEHREAEGRGQPGHGRILGRGGRGETDGVHALYVGVRSSTCASIGRPASRRSTLPGSRGEANRGLHDGHGANGRRGT